MKPRGVTVLAPNNPVFRHKVAAAYGQNVGVDALVVGAGIGDFLFKGSA